MADNFDKSAILESFLDEVSAYLPDIETNLDRLQQSPNDMRALEETYRRCHTISGSAAMMDFPALAQVAQGMEEILEDALDRNLTLDAPTIALLRRSQSRLGKLVEHIRTGEDDALVLADDMRDRSAFRGAGAAGSGRLGSGGRGVDAESPAAEAPFAPLGDPAAASGAGASPMQIPDWLAAFAEPGLSQPSGPMPASESSGVATWSANFSDSGIAPATAPGPEAPAAPPLSWGASAPGIAGMQDFSAPAAQPHRASDGWSGFTQDDAFAASSAQGNGAPPAPIADPWSTSISHLPTGAAPAIPASSVEAAVGMPGASTSAWDWSQSQPQDAPPTPRAPRPGNAPVFDGALQQPFYDGTQGGSGASSGVIAPEASAPTQLFGARGAAPAAPFIASYPPSAALPTGALATPSSYASSSSSSEYAPVTVSAPAAQTHGLALSSLDELRVDEEAMRRQVAALRDVIVELREAAQTMDDERTELRSFLDGSKDALERLEDWAGQQMGLDLRHSPESVRRYLPLSIVWVMTTRLKKLVALLHNSGRSLTAQQEQIEETLGELRRAVEGVAGLYSSVGGAAQSPDGGFSATIAHFSWSPQPADVSSAVTSPELPERIPAAELSPGARVEIERAVREELRRELEDEVRDEIAAEMRRDEEQRLRHELEIQVRRQLLIELAPGLGASGVLPGLDDAQVAPALPFAERPARQTQVTSDQSAEALEVFREEALEHLQTITTGVAELEHTPGNVDVLRSIRRAMHTLKGAAGMMGFTVIQHVAHASEDLLEGLTDNQISFGPEVLSLILDTSEALDQLISGSLAPEAQEQLAQALIQRYATIPGMPNVEGLAPVASQADTPTASTAAVVLTAEPEDEPERAASPAKSESGDLSVRIQLSKLDDLVNLFGELLINRSILEERVERLNHLVGDTVRVSERLREVGGQLETRFEAATLPSGRPSSVGGMDVGVVSRPGMGNGNGFGGSQPRRPAHAGDFDELELDRYTEFHRLSRGLSEGVADAVTLSHEMETLVREIQTSFARENRLSSDFQDRLLKARLVPLQSLVPRLYRAVRASGLKEGKEVEFFVEGTETEVDRKVFEEIEGPLLHLVRNAVNHGLERPDVREQAGKPRAGKIVVSAAYEGNQVVIAVRDDGAGIDPERIRETAVARGWIDAYTHLTEKEAFELIFRPGVSTAQSVTEEAGRGVGLDVVRDTVTRLRGTVEVDSVPGQGTTFTMKFPISLQIARAVLVKVGPQTLAIPMAVVEQIGRLDYYSRVPGPTPSIEVRGVRYPLVHLAGYLRMQPDPVDERAPVLLINSGKHRFGLLVKEVVSQQEVVSKPLGAHLVDVRGVAGATVLGNGQVVLILELHELLSQPSRVPVVLPQPGASASSVQMPTAPMPALPRVSPPAAAPAASAPAMPAPSQPAWSQPASPAASSPAGIHPAAPSSPRGFVVAQRDQFSSSAHIAYSTGAQYGYLLVVDDSPSVRRVVSNMLKANGWTVQTARDGVEALEVIARERPAAVLLDIEMPRMDGYELMATIRSQEQYRALPLIVLTSRAAAKHQQRALQLGADAYMVKPYQDEDLLQTITSLVKARSA